MIDDHAVARPEAAAARAGVDDLAARLVAGDHALVALRALCPDARGRCSECPSRRWSRPSSRSSTSPWPGAGTGTVRISTVELPGRNAAVIVLSWLSSPFMIGLQLPAAPTLRRRNLSVHVPELFPGLPVLPQKHLALDQAAIAVDAGNRPHLFVGQRIAESRTARLAR